MSNNDSDNDDDDDDEQDDKQAPPLLAVAAAGLLDGASNFGVGLYYVFVDLFTLLLDVGYKWFLLLNDLIEVLEKLGKLHHLALDVLNCVVSLLDIAEG